MVVLLWAAPASAQTYGSVLNNKKTTTTTVVSPTTTPPQGSGGTNLARTGSNNVVPLGQAAAVMVGAGTLLVLGTRRRRHPRPTAG